MTTPQNPQPSPEVGFSDISRPPASDLSIPRSSIQFLKSTILGRPSASVRHVLDSGDYVLTATGSIRRKQPKRWANRAQQKVYRRLRRILREESK